MFAFTIGGVVLEAGTRRPLGGWYIEAHSSGLLGSVVTGRDGTFTVRCEHGESQPFDVCLRISRGPGGEIVHETPGLDRGVSHHEILVPLDGLGRRGLTEGGLPG